MQTAENAAKSPPSRCTSTAGFPESLNFTADPGATSEVRAIASLPPEACCEELSDALLEALSLLDVALDALLVDALLDAALLEPLAEPLPPEPELPPQAERTEAPAALTPMMLARRMNRSREIFSFNILPSLPIMGLFATRLYTRMAGPRLYQPVASNLRIRTIAGMKRPRGALG